MAHIGTTHQVDHQFGDVARMIADALQRAQRPDHIEHAGDRTRIFHHVGDQFAQRGLVLAVDGLVVLGHGQGQVGVETGESVESVEFIDLLPSEAAGVLGSRTARTSTHLVSAATDGRVIVWDLALGKMRGEARHEAAVTKLVVHPYTPLFSTSSMDHRLRTWDARTMQLVGTQYGFTDGVLDVAVGVDDGLTQGADTGGIGAFVDPARSKGYKLVGAGDEGVALVFRLT